LTANLTLDSIDVETIPNGIYTVMINFKIEEDGTLSEIKITNDPGYDLSNKVLETLNNYKGKWHPAQGAGKNIASYRRQPITFVIE
jgi:protein TonB